MEALNRVRSVRLEPITSIAERNRIIDKYLELYGDYKTEISLEILKTVRRSHSKYIVVTGIMTTQSGEGKAVTASGLSMALNRTGDLSTACLRQPSLGHFSGIKDGGAGEALRILADGINFHLTRDTRTVGEAHDSCVSLMDDHTFRGNRSAQAIGGDKKGRSEYVH